MLCPKCGSELTPNAKFCITCGVTVEAAAPVAAPVEPYVAPAEPMNTYEQNDAPADTAEAPKKEGFKIDVDAVKEQLIETLKPITNVLKPIFAKKAVRFGILGGFALLIVLGIVIGILTSGNGFVAKSQTTKIKFVEDELNIIVNGKLLKDTIKVDYRVGEDGEALKDEKGNKMYCSHTSSSSMDGKVTAVWVYDFVYPEDSWTPYQCGTLYVINGKKVQKVAEDVTSYEMSVSGKGIGYTTRNEAEEDDEFTTYTLNLYTVGNKKTTKISKDVVLDDGISYALAPNGKSVAFYEGDMNDDEEIEYTLMYSNGKNADKITSKETKLLGLSNNGKYIYAIRTDRDETDKGTEITRTVYCYNTKGEGNKLYKVDASSNYSFNKDHTQIIFYYEGKTYIATKNKEAVRASSKSVYMITPGNAGSFKNTYPVSDLYNHVYVDTEIEVSIKDSTEITTYSYDAWMIKKNSDKNQKLINNATGYPRMDFSGEYLYYLYDGDELRCAKLSDGEKATDKYVKIAEDVDGYTVSPDRKFVYFFSDDTLYSVNGKKGGKTTTVCDDEVSDMSMSTNGVLYYITEGELYATSNGKKGSKLLSDIESVSSYVNDITIAESKETMYVSTGSKKLKKLMDLK